MDTSDHETTRCWAVPRKVLADIYRYKLFSLVLVCATHPRSLPKHSRYTLYAGLFSHRFQAIWYSELVYVLDHSHSYQWDNCENIQGAINKFRDWSWHSARRRSWDACLLLACGLKSLPLWHKRLPETVRQCLTSFGRRSMCTCASSHFEPRSKCRKRRSIVCASSLALNLGKTVLRLLKY